MRKNDLTQQSLVRCSRRRKGQTTLEFTLCFVVLVFLFAAAFLGFKWAVETITNRQKAYEDTRGTTMPPKDFYTTPPINLLVGFSSEN